MIVTANQLRTAFVFAVKEPTHAVHWYQLRCPNILMHLKQCQQRASFFFYKIVD